MPAKRINNTVCVNFNVSPSIALCNGFGAGVSFSASFSDRHFSFSGGVGVTYYGNYSGLGISGTEFRKSLQASWDDGGKGLTLGTNFWSGSGGMKDLSQRTGLLGLHSGDFRATYENDGGFGIKNLGLGDRGDSFRTAALNLSVGDFSAGFNLFTGRRNVEDQKRETITKGVNIRDNNGVFHKNSYVNEQGTKHRLGILSVGYKGYRVGVNSEHVRHAIQNSVIHRGIGDGEFQTTSWDWKPYFQFSTPNQFTLW